MNWPEQERWVGLWQSVGLGGDAASWYEKLSQAYAEPQRHYHNQQHIAECLAEFDATKHLARDPVAVELALWFDDAVYDPGSNDNEECSAAMALSCLEAGGKPELAAIVGNFVMTTKSHSIDAGQDAGLLVDVDLSILGREEKRFAEYEAQIRAEYRWVPGLVFKPKRAEILQRFLDRERIYITDLFAAKYEETARRNLENSIRKLKKLMGMNFDSRLNRIFAVQPYPLREVELPLHHHQRRASLRICIGGLASQSRHNNVAPVGDVRFARGRQPQTCAARID